MSKEAENKIDEQLETLKDTVEIVKGRTAKDIIQWLDEEKLAAGKRVKKFQAEGEKGTLARALALMEIQTLMRVSWYLGSRYKEFIKKAELG